MKQLEPKTILTIGLPASLLVNIVFAGLVFMTLVPDLSGWKTIAALVGTVTWLLFSLPIFAGMALIRKRIGQFSGRKPKLIATIQCGGICFLLASIGLGTAYALRDQLVYDLPIYWALLNFIGSIGGALTMLTCINVIVRQLFNAK